MAATVNYSWTYPTVGADVDTWGGILNTLFIDADADLFAVQGTADGALQRAGGTMTGDIILAGDPTNVLHPATKQYVDAADVLKLDLAGGEMGGTLLAKQAYTAPVVDTIAGANLTIDCADSNVFTVAMTANVSSFTLSNPGNGQTVNIRFTQDGTGSRTITWPASFKWASGNSIPLSTAPNAVDLLVATWFNDTSSWLVSLSKALA